jgi:hypothetical protein
MPAVLTLATRDLRRRWRSWILLVLVLGVAGGVVLTAAAGARRTSTAFPRYLAQAGASDLLISPQGTGLNGFDPAVGHLPGVRAYGTVVGIDALPVHADGRLAGEGGVVAPGDDHYLHQVERPKILAGRLPRPDRPGEVAVDLTEADQQHLRLGSPLELGLTPGNGPVPAVLRHRLDERVVGIVVTRSDVVPTTDDDTVGKIIASASLLHSLGPGWRNYLAFDGVYVRLTPGTHPGDVIRAADALAPRYPASGGMVYAADESQQVAAVQRALHPTAVSLALFALVVGLTTLLVVGQLASRQLFATAADYPTLGALGMTARQLTLAGVLEVGVASLAGALVAGALAVAASPLMPIGAARLAEPHPGMSADFVVLGVGLVAVVVLMMARVAWPTWRLATAGSRTGAAASHGRGPVAPLTRWLTSSGAPLSTVLGVSGALDPGRGRRAVPMRSGLVGTALAVVAVAATFTFGANFRHLVSTPTLYGKTWDRAIDLEFSTIPSQIQQRLAHEPGLEALTLGGHGTVAIHGDVVPAVSMVAKVGPLLAPTVLEGRTPVNAHEVMLGTSVMRRLDLRVGQHVSATVDDGRRRTLTIVGRGVFPLFGQGDFTPTDLGQGALLTADGLSSPGEAQDAIALLRFAPGPHHDEEVAALQRSVASFCYGVDQATCVVADQRPADIADIARVEAVPDVLAGVLVAIGVAVLAQLVVLYCRRRRRDLAVLQTLGIERGQVLSITCWQASTLAVVSLVVGLPVGVAVGRAIWDLFADGLGVAAVATVPAWTVALIAPATLLVANAVAVVPGWRASRMAPALVLHGE